MIDRRAFRFFLANAGGIVGQSAIGAASLARAEQYARDHEWIFTWEYDDCLADELGDHEYWCQTAKHHTQCSSLMRSGGCEHIADLCEHEVMFCNLKIDGEMTQSLGGIIDPSPSYRRVVEAELASEALSEIQEHERSMWARYDQSIERMVTA